jgi:taurine dioxygenase
MLAHSLSVKPVTGALGAEIAGVDLSRPLDDATYALIRQTYNERGVVFFREQQLDAEAFMAFGRRFGPLTRSKLYALHPQGHDDLQEMRKAEDALENVGGEWHTDQSFRAHPVMGTALVARKVPAAGGDTMFVSMSAAYDALSAGLKHTLEGMRAVHTNANRPQQIKRRAEMNAGKPESEWVRAEETTHPVVGRHPETGRRVLYVNPTYTLRFDGWSVAESAPLLNYLYEHAQKPEFSCRFRWDVGSVAFWDNRQCWHFAVNDYAGGERVHHRFMVEGPFLT